MPLRLARRIRLLLTSGAAAIALTASGSVPAALSAGSDPSPTPSPASSPIADPTRDPAPRVQPGWISRIERLIGGRAVSVSIGTSGDVWYRHRVRRGFAPASNEKLLLSMALLGRLSPRTTVPTNVLATSPPDPQGIVHGSLWIVGHGDPEVEPADMARLARAIDRAGIRRVTGRVMGATGPFARDWFAPGWRDYFPVLYCPIPTALTFRGNEGPSGANIRDPERRAAMSLTAQLEDRGIRVRGKPGMGSAPDGLAHVAHIESGPLKTILRHMNVPSANFYAEVLGKLLAARAGLRPTIAHGAATIERAAGDAAGVAVEAHDGSGLSYANRVRTIGMVRLLWAAESQPWGDVLRGTLARGGQGTLKDRLKNVRLRAKTGTLTDRSALSGWVWGERVDGWVAFSVLSRGMSKDASVRIEDGIVRTIAADGRP